jgi:hypothetical protein
MFFIDGDVGPYWMSSEERERRKYDKIRGTKLEFKSIKELQALLTEKGINAKGGGKKKLQVVAF